MYLHSIQAGVKARGVSTCVGWQVTLCDHIMASDVLRTHRRIANRLGGAVVGRRTRDRKVTGSTPGRDTIKSTRSTQPSIPPG